MTRLICIGTGILLTGILFYFPVFLHLDSFPLRMWDESRLAVSAMEMIQSGNPLVVTFGEQPDLWSPKPPLMIWFQVFFILLLGPCELAIRMPSALATLAVCLYMMWFSFFKLKSLFSGLLASMVLLTSSGFVGLHVSRTGDYDALLTLFTTVYVLEAYWIIYRKANKWDYLRFGIALFLGMFTKGIQAVIFLPVICVFILIRTRLKSSVLKKMVFFTVIPFILMLLYYTLREIMVPGYLNAVWKMDVFDRYTTTLDRHHGGFEFYVSKWYFQKFKFWLFFLCLPFVICLDKQLENALLLRYLLCAIVFYSIVISLSGSKLLWYDAPVYPLMALTVGIGLYKMYGGLKVSITSKTISKMIPYVFVMSLFGWPYSRIVESNLSSLPYRNPSDKHQYGEFLKKVDLEKPIALCKIGYAANLDYYNMALHKKGHQSKAIYPADCLPGDRILVCEKKGYEIIKRKFKYQEISSWKGCKELIIEEVRKSK